MSTDLLHRVASSALGTYLAYVAHGLRHPEMLRPSADHEDALRALPGDDLLVDPHWCTTFAIDIDARPASIWPFIVQLGYHRAGWYTWYPFDNGGEPSADSVLPELQSLRIGDIVPDGPRAQEGFGVWYVEQLVPERALVLTSRRAPLDGREVPEGEKSAFIDCSWAFVLEPLDAGRTRLLVRVRARLQNVRRAAIVARVVRLVFGVGDTVMERSMLQGIKACAERHERCSVSSA